MEELSLKEFMKNPSAYYEPEEVDPRQYGAETSRVYAETGRVYEVVWRYKGNAIWHSIKTYGNTTVTNVPPRTSFIDSGIIQVREKVVNDMLARGVSDDVEIGVLLYEGGELKNGRHAGRSKGVTFTLGQLREKGVTDLSKLYTDGQLTERTFNT